jgi:hypothetical protein
LAALYKRADNELELLEMFATEIEAQLCVCLSESTIPSPELVEAIAVCKIRGVGAATELCFALQQEVGSFALLGGGGFEHRLERPTQRSLGSRRLALVLILGILGIRVGIHVHDDRLFIFVLG